MRRQEATLPAASAEDRFMAAVSLKADSREFSPFERNLLVHNPCSALIEMKCIFEENSVEIVYETGGMRSLDQVLAGSLNGPSAVFNICSDILYAVRICTDHLLTERDLSFADDNIFFSGDLSAVRFQYIPHGGDTMTVREKLASIADEAIEYHSEAEGMVEIMSDYKKKLYSLGSCNLEDLIFITGQCAKTCGSTRTVTKPAAEIPAVPAEDPADNKDPESIFQKMESGFLRKVKALIDDLVS